MESLTEVALPVAGGQEGIPRNPNDHSIAFSLVVEEERLLARMQLSSATESIHGGDSNNHSLLVPYNNQLNIKNLDLNNQHQVNMTDGLDGKVNASVTSPADSCQDQDDDGTPAVAANNQLSPSSSQPQAHLQPHRFRIPPELLQVAIDALQSFEFIDRNEYKGGAQGLAMRDEQMPCVCSYESGVDDPEDACGETCINRLLFIECNDRDCPVGDACQNRRFQRQDMAPVELFLTQVTCMESASNTFVAEYVGEVLTRAAFIRRANQYADSGQKHFYFMSLKQDELLDATRRGGIARFINHSCNPNCVLQKWVVGKQLRMGIFTQKDVQVGDELTFDYKFERYGTHAQKCLCGEPNCKGYIGVDKSKPGQPGDTSDSDTDGEEEERKPFIFETAGLPEEDKKAATAKPIVDIEEVRHFVQSMLHSTDKPRRVIRLLDRLLDTDMVACLRRFVQLHGFLLLKAWCRTYADKTAVVRKILMCLERLPVSTRNTVQDSKIEQVIEPLLNSRDIVISTLAQKVLDGWSKLELVYRIPKAPKKLKPPKPANLEPVKQESSSDQSRNSRGSFNGEDGRPSMEHRDLKRNRTEDYRSWRRQSEPDKDRDGHGNQSHNHHSSTSYESKKRSSQSRPTSNEFSETPLPTHWRVAYDHEGTPYYYHDITRVVQWERPSEASVASANSDFQTNLSTSSLDIPQDKVQQAIERAKLHRKMVEEEEERIRDVKRQRKEKEKLKREKEKEKSRAHQREAKLAREKEQGLMSDTSKSQVESPPEGGLRTPADSTPGMMMDISLEDVDRNEPLSTDMRKEIREQLSAMVIKYLSRYKNKLNNDDFKKHARKESRDKAAVQVNDDVKKKVKKFVDQYASKLAAPNHGTTATETLVADGT